MKQPPLPSGTTGFFNDKNVWVCTGSQMGRRDVLPIDRAMYQKVRLFRERLVDGCYDRGGAYWGAPDNLYRCVSDDCEFFLRADSREEAKEKVLEKIPGATFYR